MKTHMQKTFITSDLHFYHSNILKFQSNRKFDLVEEMNESIILEWNLKVSNNDIIYHLGDFCFNATKNIDKVASRLNGTKIFILGNHDNKKLLESYGEIRHLEMDICLFHFPISYWHKQAFGSLHFHGHTHGNFQNHGRSIDVGFDAHGKILSLDEAVSITKNKEIIKGLYENKN
jgi:calcineurin-like phosphoesterase family protein